MIYYNEQDRIVSEDIHYLLYCLPQQCSKG